MGRQAKTPSMWLLFSWFGWPELRIDSREAGVPGVRHCAGFNENDPPYPHRLMYLNTWFLVSGNSWEGLGGVLKEMCVWGQTVRLQKPTAFPVSSPCLIVFLSIRELSVTAPVL